MKADYIATLTGQAVTLVCTLAAFKLAALILGAQGFGEYAVARRVISLVYLPVFLGMGTAIPRFLADLRHPDDDTNRTRPRGLLGAAIVLVFLSCSVLVVLGALFARVTSVLLFGSAEFVSLIAPVILMVVALCLHGILYGLWRGEFRMRRAAALQALNLGGLPLGVFGLPVMDTQTYFWMLGSAIASVSLALLLNTVGIAKLAKELAASRSGLRTLISYGVPRVPGELALGALFTVPVSLTAHKYGVVQAGNVAFAIALLNACGAVLGPIGLVVLPHLARAAGRRQFSEIRAQVHRLISVAAVGGVGSGIVLWLGASLVARRFLPDAGSSSVSAIRDTAFCVPLYFAFVALRAIPDALDSRPIVSALTVASLLIVLALGTLPIGIRPTVALIVAIQVLGAGTCCAAVYLSRGRNAHHAPLRSRAE